MKSIGSFQSTAGCIVIVRDGAGHRIDAISTSTTCLVHSGPDKKQLPFRQHDKRPVSSTCALAGEYDSGRPSGSAGGRRGRTTPWEARSTPTKPGAYSPSAAQARSRRLANPAGPSRRHSFRERITLG